MKGSIRWSTVRLSILVLCWSRFGITLPVWDIFGAPEIPNWNLDFLFCFPGKVAEVEDREWLPLPLFTEIYGKTNKGFSKRVERREEHCSHVKIGNYEMTLICLHIYEVQRGGLEIDEIWSSNPILLLTGFSIFKYQLMFILFSQSYISNIYWDLLILLYLLYLTGQILF